MSDTMKGAYPLRIATVKQTAKLFDGIFSESSLRWLLFNADSNGFSACILRVGRKVLIDLNKFEFWIENQQNQPRVGFAIRREGRA